MLDWEFLFVGCSQFHIAHNFLCRDMKWAASARKVEGEKRVEIGRWKCEKAKAGKVKAKSFSMLQCGRRFTWRMGTHMSFFPFIKSLVVFHSLLWNSTFNNHQLSWSPLSLSLLGNYRRLEIYTCRENLWGLSLVQIILLISSKLALVHTFQG